MNCLGRRAHDRAWDSGRPVSPRADISTPPPRRTAPSTHGIIGSTMRLTDTGTPLWSFVARPRGIQEPFRVQESRSQGVREMQCEEGRHPEGGTAKWLVAGNSEPLCRLD